MGVVRYQEVHTTHVPVGTGTALTTVFGEQQFQPDRTDQPPNFFLGGGGVSVRAPSSFLAQGRCHERRGCNSPPVCSSCSCTGV
jgi:hypothetical protein